MIMEQTIAISYKRFSTLKQARGDSARRQTDLTVDYCRRNHLRLIDTYLDAGLSGFTGENLSDRSALSALLQAAKGGAFRPGTRLIIESMDRLSRREISIALRLFLDLLDTGLVIVTLIDGEQVFTKERIDSDMTALIIAIVYLSRANNESKHRRERALQAQKAARHRARERKIPMTAECPAWLMLRGKGDKRHFVVDQDRARVVEHIFTMSASGMGQYLIVRYLNGHNVITFAGRPKWRPGMIAHLLKNEAVIGRFHPCLNIVENGRRRRVPDSDGPIDNYYPVIVSNDLYARARGASSGRLSRRRERRIPAYTNLVARLGRCAVCGAPLHHSQSASGWAYLRCANARHQECSNRFGFPYRMIESTLLAMDYLTELVDRLVLKWVNAAGASHVAQPGKRKHKSFRDDLINQQAFLERFRSIKPGAQSANLFQRDAARKALVAEFRTFIQGVVLQPDYILTIHVKHDFSQYRVAYILGRDGLSGAQVKLPEGVTGLIGQAILAEIVPPTKCKRAIPAGSDGPEQMGDSDDLLARIQVTRNSAGDWQAGLHHPQKLAKIVNVSEAALGQGC